MRNKHSFFLGSLYLLVWTAWGTAPEAPASAFTVHKIFGSNMVLQSDRPIKISGNAAPGEIIRVSLGSHCADGVAGKDGEWCVELPAMKAGMRPYTVTVSGGGRQSAVVFENVLIGEVWLASGQSNMEMPVYSGRPFWGSANGAQEAAARVLFRPGTVPGTQRSNRHHQFQLGRLTCPQLDQPGRLPEGRAFQ